LAWVQRIKAAIAIPINCGTKPKAPTAVKFSWLHLRFRLRLFSVPASSNPGAQQRGRRARRALCIPFGEEHRGATAHRTCPSSRPHTPLNTRGYLQLSESASTLRVAYPRCPPRAPITDARRRIPYTSTGTPERLRARPRRQQTLLNVVKYKPRLTLLLHSQSASAHFPLPAPLGRRDVKFPWRPVGIRPGWFRPMSIRLAKSLMGTATSEIFQHPS